MTGAVNEDAAAGFAPLRPKLMRVAYRMLGSVADAEDVVQDPLDGGRSRRGA
jgi:RNA polymerase sigma-70 factor (ECF subfamily)